MYSDLVSVIIPTYKRADRLEDAINSVLQQTYSNIEIIVVDDNNDDDEFRIQTEVLMSTFKDHKNVYYLKHHKNLNGSAARNTGIDFSNGKYIAFLDDDDLFLKEKIEKQVDFLENRPGYSAVCCAYISKYEKYTYKKNTLKVYENGNYVYSLLSGENRFGAGSTLLIKKDVVLKMNGFDASFIRHQDFEFLIRFFRLNEKLLVLNKNLSIINVHGERNYPDPDTFLKIKLNFLDTFKIDIKKESEKRINKIYSHHFKELVIAYWKHGRIKDGYWLAKKYKKYINLDPKFIIVATYSFLESKFQFLQKLKYKIFSIRYFKITFSDLYKNNPTH